MKKDDQIVLKMAVETLGKTAQVDMMIEEMAELTKAFLNERRGRDHNIAEEMADIKIMLAQMEIIFQNAGEVERIFQEKVARLYCRLCRTLKETLKEVWEIREEHPDPEINAELSG